MRPGPLGAPRQRFVYAPPGTTRAADRGVPVPHLAFEPSNSCTRRVDLESFLNSTGHAGAWCASARATARGSRRSTAIVRATKALEEEGQLLYGDRDMVVSFVAHNKSEVRALFIRELLREQCLASLVGASSKPPIQLLITGVAGVTVQDIVFILTS